MGINSYFMKYIKVTYITRRRSEMKKTIENLKNNIYTFNTYSCKNIIYHMKDVEGLNINNNDYIVKIDENIENLLKFINPLNICNKKDNDEKITSFYNINKNNLDIKEDDNLLSGNDMYILKYKINHIIGKRGKREQYRYTYLKSPFKYKYALRHYVFEKYKYHFYFYNITHFNIHIIFNIILSSMTSNTSVKCNINWFFPGKHLFESDFLRKCFHILMEKRLNNNTLENYNEIKKIIECFQDGHNNNNENNQHVNKDDGDSKLTPSHDINLDLTKYNIQNILPLFFENKLFSENYKNLFLHEEKCFKNIKSKMRKKNIHWFINKSTNI